MRCLAESRGWDSVTAQVTVLEKTTLWKGECAGTDTQVNEQEMVGVYPKENKQVGGQGEAVDTESPRGPRR